MSWPPLPHSVAAVPHLIFLLFFPRSLDSTAGRCFPCTPTSSGLDPPPFGLGHAWPSRLRQNQCFTQPSQRISFYTQLTTCRFNLLGWLLWGFFGILSRRPCRHAGPPSFPNFLFPFFPTPRVRRGAFLRTQVVPVIGVYVSRLPSMGPLSLLKFTNDPLLTVIILNCFFVFVP